MLEFFTSLTLYGLLCLFLFVIYYSVSIIIHYLLEFVRLFPGEY